MPRVSCKDPLCVPELRAWVSLSLCLCFGNMHIYNTAMIHFVLCMSGRYLSPLLFVRTRIGGLLCPQPRVGDVFDLVSVCTFVRSTFLNLSLLLTRIRLTLRSRLIPRPTLDNMPSFFGDVPAV